MYLFQHRQGSLTALVAALVLVLQSSLTLWAFAAVPADPMLDRWGNPLCITGMNQDGDNPATDHSGMLDCCTFGCGVSSASLAAPSGAGIALLPPPVRVDALWGARKAVDIQIADHDPGSPRAPPLTV